MRWLGGGRVGRWDEGCGNLPEWELREVFYWRVFMLNELNKKTVERLKAQPLNPWVKMVMKPMERDGGVRVVGKMLDSIVESDRAKAKVLE